MNIILLSGGSGKRLWPLSNEQRSKQFIKIFKNENGEYESMVERIYAGIKRIDSDSEVTVATAKSQVSAIRNQLGADVGISVEPCRRDTFPAIALACAYLHDVKGVPGEEPVVVCPVDPYVEDDYFESLKKLSKLAEEGKSNLTLMGMTPTYPSSKYGYIIPENDSSSDERDEVSFVSCFKEKPDEKTAEEYIAKGALWNGGIFAFKLQYLLDKTHELVDFTDYDDLYSRYESMPKISFDYAVVEKEKSIRVMRFNGIWKDLGTWNTLTESMTESVVGQGTLGDDNENVHIVNELNVPILSMGLKDVVIAASAEGILVSDKHMSSYIKPFVDGIDSEIMFAEKSWGSYKVIDVNPGSMTIKVTLRPGNRMNYHSHELRDEIWTIVSGKGRIVVDGMEQIVNTGDVITIKAGCKHTIFAETELQVIEVQLGKEISVHDKRKFELE